MDERYGAPTTVLVIDDDAGDRMHILRSISQSGLDCIVLEAVDVDPAMVTHGDAFVDLILLDYNLPSGSGLSALNRIRDKWPNATSVLTTGEGSETVVAEAFRAGVCDYISKRDISARSIRRVVENGVKARRLELQLAAQTEELKLFAHLLAHDVKAPLRAIRNLSEWAIESLGEGDTATTISELNYIGQSAARLDALIESLQAYLDSDYLPTFASEATEDLAQLAVSNLRLEISECGADVQIEALPMIEADRGQIIQLFQNLISNALKFSKEDIPTVVISASAINTDVHTICVSDNGIGISPIYAERIFEPFKRLHTQDKFAGSGLGLATCRKIVSRHGGNIWCEPSKSGGARFCFSLPAAKRPLRVA
ncbi:hypothetical protein A8B78_11165 [Jannaschia sp. EhC01]|nr:hypothetical protein A8B78_11165 [Jannaschia sp. EhC01]